MIEPHQPAERAPPIGHHGLRKRLGGLSERSVGKTEPGVEITRKHERIVALERLHQSTSLPGARVLAADEGLVDPDTIVEMRARHPKPPWISQRTMCGSGNRSESMRRMK